MRRSDKSGGVQGFCADARNDLTDPTVRLQTEAQARAFKFKGTHTCTHKHTICMDLLTVTRTWGGHCQTPSISNDCDLGNLSNLTWRLPTTPAQTGSKGNATLWYTLGICGRCHDHGCSLYGKHRQRPDGPGRSSCSNLKGVLRCSEMCKKNPKKTLYYSLLLPSSSISPKTFKRMVGEKIT